MKLNEAEALIEALLFISGGELELSELAEAVHLDNATTRAIILSLRDKYEEEMRGIELAEIGGYWQLRSSPRLFGHIKAAFHSERRQGMSQTLLETLAIIAYKQPISKSGIEEIRGV
ncbi:MAG: SMC-Scp complex subunit ScpB, partial [Firmicutes bacterium]|nr:SMC-Scp complex subunit ScpB [Bacillota bacterium]